MRKSRVEMMNKREVCEWPRRISNRFKDREEELSFFRDLQKREKNQVASLLQPVSEEFDANGSNGLYRMESGRRKGAGLEFLAESGKNDYNWLKTPPATPLFPSLEMETNAQELVIQREIPIIQPLSRIDIKELPTSKESIAPDQFAGNPEASKTENLKTVPKSLNPKPKPPPRHKTPNGRPITPSILADKKNMKTPPMINQKTDRVFTPAVKSTREPRPNYPYSYPSKSIGMDPNPSTKPKTGGPISPSARPKTPGFSDETPPNLRTTNRATSANRGRPMSNQNHPTAPRKQEAINPTVRRQSCSPSVARGRKVECDGKAGRDNRQAGNRAQVSGSRMVDRFMNARISNVGAPERQPKTNSSGSMNEAPGFGRLMPKSSLDVAFKHMEIKRDSIGKNGMLITGRKS